jgi:hypothetical protein
MTKITMNHGNQAVDGCPEIPALPQMHLSDESPAADVCPRHRLPRSFSAMCVTGDQYGSATVRQHTSSDLKQCCGGMVSGSNCHALWPRVRQIYSSYYDLSSYGAEIRDIGKESAAHCRIGRTFQPLLPEMSPFSGIINYAFNAIGRECRDSIPILFVKFWASIKIHWECQVLS